MGGANVHRRRFYRWVSRHHVPPSVRDVKWTEERHLTPSRLTPQGRAVIARQMSRSPHGGLGAIGCTDLAQDGFDMNFDSGFSHIELAGDDLVGRTFGEA